MRLRVIQVSFRTNDDAEYDLGQGVEVVAVLEQFQPKTGVTTARLLVGRE